MLDKENAYLRSNISRLAFDRENLKLNLNQKRDRAVKTAKEIHKKQYKRRNVGEALKGTYKSLSVKKKKLAEAQYEVWKIEINCQDQLKKLQDQLDSF